MKLKVCGMKYPDNILKVGSLQPDYLGLIFYEKSPRNFTGPWPEVAESITKIGVCVNATTEEVTDIVSQCNLDELQLHGSEPVEYRKDLKVKVQQSVQSGAASKLPLIVEVFSVKADFDVSPLNTYEPLVGYFLVA